jgi:hypothetical protein
VPSSPFATRALHLTAATLTLAGAVVLTLPFARVALVSLRDLGLVGRGPASLTVIAAGVIVAVGLAVGRLAPPRGRRIFLASAFAFAGLAVVALAVLSGTAGALLAITWLLLLGCSAAERLLRPWLAVASGCERTVLATALGAGLTSHLGLALAMSGLLYRWLLVTILVVGTFLLRREMWERLRLLHGALARGIDSLARDERAWFTLPVAAYLAFFAVLLFVQAIAPEIQYDALNYHLAVPRIYLQHHRLVATPWIMQSWLAGGADMNYLIAMLLANQTAAKLYNLAFLALTAAGVYVFARRHLPPASPLIAAALVVTTPLLAWEGTTTYTDLPSACFCLLALVAAARWLEGRAPAWLVVAGLLAGFAISAKLIAGLLVAPLAVVVLVASLARSGVPLRGRLAPVLAFATPTCAAALPWPLVRYLQTGNPVFPLLNGIFRSPLWQPVNERFNLAGFGIGTNLASVIRMPWAISFDVHRFSEMATPGVLGAAVLATPLIVLLRRWQGPTLLIAFVLAAFSASWALSAQYLRYLLPALPLMCLLVAAVVAGLHDGPRRGLALASGVIGNFVAGVWVLAALPLWLSLYWQLPEHIPWAVAIGREGRPAYLSRTLATYDACRYLNATYQAASVYVVALGSELGFYLDGKLVSLTSRELEPILALSTPSEVLAFVRGHGISHLLIDRGNVGKGLESLPILRPCFLQAVARLEFAARNIYLYCFLTAAEVEAATAAPECAELLGNPGFEAAGDGTIAGWGAIGRPLREVGSGRGHSGAACVRVSADAVYYQAVGVEPGRRYLLSQYSRAASPDCLARGQINWEDEHGQVEDVALEVWPCTVGWTQHTMAVTAPGHARRAVVFANAQKGEVWLDDFSLTRQR